MRNHPTADEIYYKLKKDFKRLSLATVYRNLNSFVKNGDIRSVNLPGFGHRFDYRLDHHEHIFCQRCNNVFDVDIKLDTRDLLPEDSDIQILGYDFMLYGVCEGCKDK